MTEQINRFLERIYKLHTSKEVKMALNRVGGGDYTNINSLIGTYLKRFQDILCASDNTPEQNKKNRISSKEKSINALKKILYHRFIIKPEEIPESYWKLQEKILVERGQGTELEDGKLPEKIKRQEIERILTEQKNSLDIWIDYLSDETAQYDIGLKYWAVRSILGLQSYNKKRGNFPKRSKGSINPFPELNREALAYTFDFMLAKIQGEEIKKPNEGADEEKFKKVLNDEGFGNIYSFALQEMTKTYGNILENINGEWKKYYRGTNHIPLVESLRGKATGWCTTGEKTAKKQLNGGDFYVYYSQDKNGRNTIPRLGIRMKNGEIAEIRGIAENQNMDPYIQSVLEEKLKEFGSEGEKYKKKVSDMNKLTEIYNNPTRELSREDLVFLYEIDYEISGFGYKKDPRIGEIHQKRNFEKDLLRIFDGTIKRIEGDLDLSRLEALPEGFEFPEEIGGSLDLRELEILPKGVKLLRKIGGNLYLSRKALQEGIKLPEVGGRVVYFNSLKALQEGLNLSKFLKNEDKEIISKEIIKSSEIYF